MDVLELVLRFALRMVKRLGLRWTGIAGVLMAVLIAASLVLAGCQLLFNAPNPTPSSTATPAWTNAPTPTLVPSKTLPPLALPTSTWVSDPEAFWKDFPIPDFDVVHAPVNGSANEYLIFGNLPVKPPTADLPSELAVFLGRWEWRDSAPPLEFENRGVLLVQEIDKQGGVGYLWAGADLQYPFFVKEFHFRVLPGTPPGIEWNADFTGAPEMMGVKGMVSLSYNPDQEVLHGGILIPPSEEIDRPIEMRRGESAYVYKDYVNYLESKRITFKEYLDRQMQRYGLGYAIYLPEGYEAELDRTWPLIVFLIGSGERGQTFPMLKRHGPLRTIVEQGGLPFIVVVPMLNLSSEFRSFPEAYLDGVFDEILADYRIDPSRIYLTGLSMGGEATYRYTLHRPELFAAIAPMAAFDAKYLPGAIGEGFAPFELPMERIKDIPVWAVHGADDHIVPLAAAQSTVDALKEAGGNVRFTVRPGRRHDAWTEMYADPAFYEWLLQFQKP